MHCTSKPQAEPHACVHLSPRALDGSRILSSSARSASRPTRRASSTASISWPCIRSRYEHALHPLKVRALEHYEGRPSAWGRRSHRRRHAGVHGPALWSHAHAARRHHGSNRARCPRSGHTRMQHAGTMAPIAPVGPAGMEPMPTTTGTDPASAFLLIVPFCLSPREPGPRSLLFSTARLRRSSGLGRLGPWRLGRRRRMR